MRFLISTTWTIFSLMFRTRQSISVGLGTSPACSVTPSDYTGQRPLRQRGSLSDIGGLYDIRNSRTWTEENNAHQRLQKSDLCFHGTLPSSFDDFKETFSGIVVSTFVKHACQSVLHSMNAQPGPNAAQPPRRVTSIPPGGNEVTKLFRTTVDLRADVPKADHPLLSSLRGLLVQELRRLIKDSTKPWSSALTSLYRREVADRFRLSASFSKALENLRAEFESRTVLQAAAGGSAGARKVVLVDVLQDVPTVLLEDSMVSSTLQNFLARILQYSRLEVVMQREAIEKLLCHHLRVPRPERQFLQEVFAYITGPELLFSEAAKFFVVDVLQLTAAFYNEHSRRLLGILESDDEALRFLSSRLSNTATTYGWTVDHFSLDLYGFASALKLITWQAENEYDGAALLQSSCRFVYAPAFSKRSVVSRDRQKTAVLTSTRFITPFLPINVLTKTFAVCDDVSPLQMYKQLSAWRRMDPPSERIQIYQLNAAEALNLRKMASRGTMVRSPLVGMSDANQVGNKPRDNQLVVLLKSAFERAVAYPGSPLGTLLNMELDQLLRSRSAAPPSTWFPQTLSKRLNTLVRLQKREAVRQFKASLENLAKDANNKLESFFSSEYLIEKILDTPFYYPRTMLDPFLSIASIPELGDVKLALALSFSGFKAAQQYFFRNPLAPSTHLQMKHRKIYRRTGAQKCLRTSLLSRLNHVVRLGLEISSRFFDTKLDLLSAQDLSDLQAGVIAVADQHALTIVPTSAVKPPIVEMNFYGFLSATILTAYSELLLAPVILLDSSDRLFFVKHIRANNRPEFVISTESGSFKWPWNPRLANVIQRVRRKAHEFMNLTLWGEREQGLPERIPFGASEWFKRFAPGLFDEQIKESTLNVRTIRNFGKALNAPSQKSGCSALAEAFPRCIAHALLRCSSPSDACNEFANYVNQNFDKFYDAVWSKIVSSRLAPKRLLSAAPWSQLDNLLTALIKVNESTWTQGELRLLQATPDARLQSAAVYEAVRLLVLRLEIHSPNGGYASDLKEALEDVKKGFEEGNLSAAAVYRLAKQCKENLLSTFRKEPSAEQVEEEAEYLEEETQRAKKALETVGFEGDEVNLATLKGIIIDAYSERHENVFDFVLGSLPSASLPAAFKRHVMKCLYGIWQENEATARMFSELNEPVLDTFSPSDVRNCFVRSIAKVFSKGDISVPRQAAAMSKSVYLFFVIFHRFRVIVEAEQAYKRNVESKLAYSTATQQVERVVESLQKLSVPQFRRLLRYCPGFSVLQYSFLAALLEVDLHVVEADSQSTPGRLLRIVARRRHLLFRRRRSVDVICAPVCHVSSGRPMLEKLLRTEMRNLQRNSTTTTLETASLALDKLRHMAARQPEEFQRALALLPADNSVFDPVAEAPICQSARFADFFVVTEICEFETVTKSFFAQALVLTVGLYADALRKWLRFWTFNHRVLFSQALSRAQQLGQEYRRKGYTAEPKWRSYALSGFTDAKDALLQASSSSSSRKSKALLSRISTRLRKLKRAAAKTLRAALRPRCPRKPALDRTKAVPEQFSVEDTLTPRMILDLPTTFAVNAWQRFAFCVDAHSNGVAFVPAYSLAAATAMASRFPEAFADQASLMYASIRESRELQTKLDRLAVEVAVDISARNFSVQPILAHISAAVEVVCAASQQRSTTLRPLCNAVAACQGRGTASRQLSESAAHCRLSGLHAALTSSLVETVSATLRMLKPLFEKIGRRVVIWSQPSAKLFTLEPSADPVDISPKPSIQIVIETPQATAAGQSGVHRVKHNSSSCGLSFVTPAFDLKHHLVEATAWQPARHLLVDNFASDALKSVARFLQDRIREVAALRYSEAEPFASMTEIIRSVIQNEYLAKAQVLEPSGVVFSFGPDSESQALITQQTQAIEQMLGLVGHVSLLDFSILKNLTLKQALICCKHAKGTCSKVAAALQQRLTQSLVTLVPFGNSQEVAVEREVTGVFERIKASTVCLPNTKCIQETEQAIRRLKGLLSTAHYYKLQAETFDSRFRFDPTEVKGSLKATVVSVRSTITLPQWHRVLKDVQVELREAEEKTLDAPDIDSLSQFGKTCFEVAQKRLLSSLATLQQSEEENAPNWTRDIGFNLREAHTREQQMVDDLLLRCCAQSVFTMIGPIATAHRLLRALRAQGFTLEWTALREELLDNSLTYLTWIQRARNVHLQSLGTSERLMFQVCPEPLFWEVGAKECTSRFVRLVGNEDLKISEHSAADMKSLEDLTQTYEEWMQKSHNVLLVSKKPQAAAARYEYDRAESSLWTRVARELYARPSSTWPSVEHSIRLSSGADAHYLDVVGTQAARSLYEAVQALRWTLFHVREEDFARFGAFLLTETVMWVLAEQGIYETGNSAVTLKRVRTALRFAEWRNQMLFLKFSKGTMRQPVPRTWVAGLKRHCLFRQLLRLLSGGKRGRSLVRSVVRSVFKLRLAPALARSLEKALESSQAAQQPDVSSWRGEGVKALPALVGIVVAFGGLMGNYLGTSIPFSSLLLPMVVSLMKSPAARGAVETLVRTLDLPQLVLNLLFVSLPRLEELVVNVARQVATEILQETLGKRMRRKIDAAAVFARVHDALKYAFHLLYLMGPAFFTGISHGFIRPLVEQFTAGISRILLAGLDVAADFLTFRALRAPAGTNEALLARALRNIPMTESFWLMDIYIAVAVLFSKNVFVALTEQTNEKVEMLAVLSPAEKLASAGLFLNDGLPAVECPFASGHTWKVHTNRYKFIRYRSGKVAVSGFAGELRFYPGRGSPCQSSFTFFIEHSSLGVVINLKKLSSFLHTRSLTFDFRRTETSTDRASLAVTDAAGTVETFTVRFQRILEIAVNLPRQIRRLETALEISTKRLSAERRRLLEHNLQPVSHFLPGANALDLLLLESRELTKLNLYRLLLQYEYYSRDRWFALDYALSLRPSLTRRAAVELTVYVGTEAVPKVFMVDLFHHQAQILQLDKAAREPCKTRGRVYSKFKMLIMRKSWSATSCFKLAELYPDDSGHSVLHLRWQKDAGPISVRLVVEPLDDPRSASRVEMKTEHVLRDRDIATLKDSVRATEAHDREAAKVAKWMVFFALLRRAVLEAYIRRQRRMFDASLSAIAGAEKDFYKARDYATRKIFQTPNAVDPAWLLRLDVLLQRPKYAVFKEMLGNTLEIFKDSVATALSNLPHVEKTRYSYVTAGQLERLCPFTWSEGPEKREKCEMNYGLWGTLRLTDPQSPLLGCVDTGRMKTPVFYEYWVPEDGERRARYAVGDLEKLQHCQRQESLQIRVRLTDVDVFGASSLLNIYAEAIQDGVGETSADSARSYQIARYLYIHLLQLIEHYKTRKTGEGQPAVRDVLRRAGTAGLKLAHPAEFHSHAEKHIWYSRLADYAEEVYTDVELSLQVGERWPALPTSGRQQEGTSRPTHFVLLTKWLHQSPFAHATGYQVAQQNVEIVVGCSAAAPHCPSPEVLWNHTYVALLVILQVSSMPELLVDLFDVETAEDDEHADELLVGSQAVYLFQFGLGIVRRWILSRDLAAQLTRSVNVAWIRSLLALFDGDETLKILMQYVPPLHLHAAELLQPVQVLRKAVWNALAALAQLRLAYGRLSTDIQVYLHLRRSNPVPYSLQPEAEERRVPPHVWDRLHTRINEVLRVVSTEGQHADVLDASRRKLIVHALREGSRLFRRTGHLELSNSFFKEALQHFRESLARNASTESLALLKQLEGSEVQHTLLVALREAALQTAVAAQLDLDQPRAFLWGGDLRVPVDNLKSMLTEFASTGKEPEDFVSRLEALYKPFCAMVLANASGRALSVLGYRAELFTEFKQVQQYVRSTLEEAGYIEQQHPVYSLETDLQGPACSGVPPSVLALSSVAAACHQLEEVLGEVFRTIPFSSRLFKEIKAEEAKAAEQIVCDTQSEDGKLLRASFVEMAAEEVRSRAVTEYWQNSLNQRGLLYDSPDLEVLPRNVVAAVLHRLALHGRAGTLTAEMRQATYAHVCRLISYTLNVTQRKKVDFCRVFDQPRLLLRRLLDTSIGNQLTRLQVISLSASRSVTLPAFLPRTKIQERSALSPQSTLPSSGDALRRLKELLRHVPEANAISEAAAPAARVLSDSLQSAMNMFYRKKLTWSRGYKWLVNAVSNLLDAAMERALQVIFRLVSASEKHLVEMERNEAEGALKKRRDSGAIQFKGRRPIATKQKVVEKEGEREVHPELVFSQVLSQANQVAGTASSKPDGGLLINSVSKLRDNAPKSQAGVLMPPGVTCASLCKRRNIPEIKWRRSLKNYVGHTVTERLNRSFIEAHRVPEASPGLLRKIAYQVITTYAFRVHRWTPISLRNGILRGVNRVAVTMRTPPTAPGSLKHTLVSACNDVGKKIFSILRSDVFRACEVSLRNLFYQAATQIHYSLLPGMGTLEETFSSETSGSTAFLKAFAKGVTIATVSELETMLRDPVNQSGLLKVLGKIFNHVTRSLTNFLQKEEVAGRACKTVKPIIDTAAELVEERAEVVLGFAADLLQTDILGEVLTYAEAILWMDTKMLYDSGELRELLESFVSSNLVKVLFETARREFLFPEGETGVPKVPRSCPETVCPHPKTRIYSAGVQT